MQPLFILIFLSLFSLSFSLTMNKTTLPKLIAFDLDGTVWTPDMYQLWGGGAPFKVTSNRKELLDRNGQTVRLLGIIDTILHDLSTNPGYTHIKVAWVSCTDEPDWAEECLQKFTTSGNQPIGTTAHSSQIYKANKQKHFKNLRLEYPEIEYNEMLFFDNEYYNIENVIKLGVKCIYCPKGMTQKAWDEGLKLFET